MQHCIYLRKSRADMDAEARGEGETLVRHERTLVELGKYQALNIGEIYKEIVSGETIAARPVMQRLLQEVAQGIWSGVLVMEVERLARGDTVDQGIIAQTFKYSNTKIITPAKTYDPNNEFDEEYFEFGLFMSRREYKTINRRLQRGRLASVKEGKFVGNKTPYGYVRKKLESCKGFSLEPHPEEAEIIKLIFDLYAHGEKQDDGTDKRLGVSLICHRLNSLKIKPKKSDTWVSASVRDILINPVYKGKIRWNWRPNVKKMKSGEMTIERPRTAIENCIVADGLHEAIIEDETWELVQKLMRQNPPCPAPSLYPLKNPLAGVVYCGKCGRKMVRRPHNTGISDTLMCSAVSCNNVSSKLSLVEESILLALKKWLVNYKVIYGVSKENPIENVQTAIKSKVLKKIDEEIKNTEAQIANLHDLLEQQVYSIDTFRERSKALSDRLKKAHQDRAALSIDTKHEMIFKEAEKSMISKAEEVMSMYYCTKNPKIKNDLLKEVLDKAIYTKTANTRWHGDPSDFEIELLPRMPK